MAVLPVVAIVGRPNVGKSTLFNQLTRTREALVADEAGLTRDRQYGTVRHMERPFVVVDTGGLATQSDRIGQLIGQQAERAMEEADAILLLLDGREGLTPEDEHIAAKVRTVGCPVLPVVNKIDGLNSELVTGEFHALGLGDLHPISAAHARGLRSLGDAVLACLPPLFDLRSVRGSDPGCDRQEAEAPAHRQASTVRVAIVGRPNVGKSTLVNQLVGEVRVVAHDMPGTTRDSIYVPFSRGGRSYTLIDTAGVRRRPRVHETIEKFSVIKTLQAIEAANVVVLMLDATEGLAEQDLRILGHVLDAGRALVLAINKWDAADRDNRSVIEKECDRRLRFVDYATVQNISATLGSGVGALMRSVNAAWQAATAKLPTPELTRLLADAVAKHPPPLVRGRRIKLRYAHQGGVNPPRIVIHGSQTEALPASYQRYLTRVFRDTFKLYGTPVALELRTGENPFKDRQNTLSKRQQQKRRRLMKHVKKRR